MYHKSIIQGRLEFGNPKSYEKVVKLFHSRAETYYKSDILLKEETYFNDENKSIVIPRMVIQSTDKAWKNTVNLLEYISQFAVSGWIGVWMTDSGTIKRYAKIEPNCDKAAVQSFLKGKQLYSKKGKEKEALDALSTAIDKYDRHAQAYEHRAYVNFKLGNIEDALYDFDKSLKIDPTNPEAYVGRAKLNWKQGKQKEAIEDLDKSIKNAIALQPVYWRARLLKAEYSIKLNDYTSAAFDLKWYTKRKFLSTDKNYLRRKYAFFLYGKVLLELEQYGEAIEAFEEALTITESSDRIKEADILMQRGLARQKNGKKGFLKDWKEAASQGSKKAKTLLEAHS
jgi:tetratricopeptide (TPR) repeat protein